ncbi:xanthine phosphoribosyltransferase [Desulfonatronum thioautotrophicum]|uniref:xanthine phosphoribosyltransferase n=1 Tax=Desulfonatronum thioautotrophicum TaxID=617001 RepID=UPI0005EB5E86|nr:xanthine phosphoribosyltransferase [Desulfonatronum thioautotrophicum]
MTMKDRYNKLYPISWDQLHRDSKVLAWRLLDLGPWHGIVTITRGGLVPAAIIARELEIRVIDTVCVSSYAWQDQGQSRVLKSFQPLSPDVAAKTLIIDDLVDTGRTAQVVREMLPQAHFATVYAKPAGRPMVDTYITEVSQDTWILFPWDSEARFVEPLADQRGCASL